MKSIVSKSLKNGMTYLAYRTLVKQLSEQNSTTGNEKTEDLATFTKLNDKRMNRWDKTLKVSDAAQKKINEFETKVTWLVITESWCGDAAHVLPVLNKIAELNSYIDLKIVLRDENLELMDAFLTNGSLSVPKLIMVENETGNVVNTYGPRPSEATSLVNRYKAKYGVLTPDFKEDLQHWYNNNKGQNIIDDVTDMLYELQSNFCQ
ncbi:thiol-disulfide isomerase/thioredoxin [Mariniflexile fucanivorans]|uniref:Thiol-disulfide isomerase/thioredoxin n=1 Tax=Mariniflexile fucanivorans TaxID=264023 RepID=A0A4R1RR70_9FLAO|nr:thioredoxin family protein [Mariniflexile fucanivorans]TCL68824.1 thiol-disulfide isomerase/thioredoxin [Mariniflexile fucanivorans]